MLRGYLNIFKVVFKSKVIHNSQFFLPFGILCQTFAMLSDKLEPLVEGVRSNKEHWLEKAMTNHVDEVGEDDDMVDSGYV